VGVLAAGTGAGAGAGACRCSRGGGGRERGEAPDAELRDETEGVSPGAGRRRATHCCPAEWTGPLAEPARGARGRPRAEGGGDASGQTDFARAFTRHVEWNSCPHAVLAAADSRPICGRGCLWAMRRRNAERACSKAPRCGGLGTSWRQIAQSSSICVARLSRAVDRGGEAHSRCKRHTVQTGQGAEGVDRASSCSAKYSLPRLAICTLQWDAKHDR